jgi:hypothetical protein
VLKFVTRHAYLNDDFALRGEIHSAYLLNDQEPPDKPTFNEVLRLVARPGGVLGRKSDGEPGVKTIWPGLKEVSIAAKRSANYEIELLPGLMYDEVGFPPPSAAKFR